MSNAELIAEMEERFIALGIKAICADPKSALYAKVNPIDKFVLAMRLVADSAILEEVGKFDKKWQYDWFQNMHDKPWYDAHNSKFAALVNCIAARAYEKIESKSAK